MQKQVVVVVVILPVAIQITPKVKGTTNEFNCKGLFVVSAVICGAENIMPVKSIGCLVLLFWGCEQPLL